MVALFTVQTTSAGEPAPDFEGEDLHSGEQVSLSAYRGTVVLIDFWASWCPPCLLSLPAYDSIRRDLHSSGFEVIAINVDADTADGLDFLEAHPVSYPVIADPDGLIGVPYGIRTVPRSFLVDRQGRIVSSHRSFRPGDELRLRMAIEKLVIR